MCEIESLGVKHRWDKVKVNTVEETTSQLIPGALLKPSLSEQFS